MSLCKKFVRRSVLLILGWIPAVALGQGITQTILNTGSGQVLLTQTVSYTSSAGIPFLSFDFGFATQETSQPGLFGDSFTISATGGAGSLYLLTVDANGVQWAPNTPGAAPVSDSDLQRSLTSFLVAAGGLTPIASYQVTYALPAAWQGVPLTVNFDLFDNQNTQPSLAYFSVTQVPEPSVTALMLIGLVACARVARRR